ncbi:MAG: cell division protein FtsZ [Bacteroidales bacterium]|nr:cell division protein FtsZ [Bacteroidales bacterium]
MEENFYMPTDNTWVPSDNTIKVIGVGGGGCNAVEYMFRQGIQGCNFIVCNTDASHLNACTVPVKIQLGTGLGAGTDPTKGRNAALEKQDEIASRVLNDETQMVFITAGMGGGTGTGASPVIARMAKEKGILTVAVVTIPFLNEGDKALTRALEGIHELEKNVDSLIIINNENLYKHYGKLLVHDAYPKADEVLATAVKGIVEIIQKRGYQNVDFEDVKTMLRDSGMALMGSGYGSGKDRIQDAVKSAFECKLLNDFNLKSAKYVLTNTTVGKNDHGLTMEEMEKLGKLIEEYTGKGNNFKRGLIYDESPEAGDSIRITAIVAGLKYDDVIGESLRSSDNYIMLDSNYKYDRYEEESTDGISLPAENIVTHIGFNSRENERTFNYDKDDLPTLLRLENAILDMENTPAIRRAKKSKANYE